ncbi:MAG TPA: hypothetical protein VMZ92_08710 [Planctomycetota bacterium]|nr:hypothetical protein [Planctomycetota bacterium]
MACVKSTMTALVALAVCSFYAGAEDTYRFRLDAGPTGSKAEVKPPLVSDEGLQVVEVAAPGALTQSNTRYMVTTDIEAPGTAFTLGNGVTNVILDLGGRVVTYNAETQPKVPGKPYGECVYGLLIRGRGIEGIVIRNGTIVQGKGSNAGSHAISIQSGKRIEICDTNIRVHGPSTSNLATVWTGPDGRVHDNYLENRSRDTAPGLFAPTGINLSQTAPGWEIYNNTVVGGHQAVAVWANAAADQRTAYEIHHNRLSPRRIHGLKAPQGILCFGSDGNHIYENEIATDDARGINLQGRGSGNNNVHNNLIACRYSTEATEGNYVENRCYGYWERDGNANRLHANVWIVGNEVTGDGTSNSVGILATTTGGRLKSAQYTQNRIICSHSDPGVDVLGFDVKRSDKDVIVRGNEIFARTSAVRVWSTSDGVQVKENVLLRTPATAADAPMLSGDCIDKCTREGNVETTLRVDDDPPRPPTGLHVIQRHEALELRWDRSAEKDVIGYNVYCDGRKLNPYPVGGCFHVHVDVKAGQTHLCQVTALDLAGRESARSAPLVAVKK